MPTAQEAEARRLPLTALSEEERFFQSTVRKFAREEIGPHVREMDEACVFRKDIIRHTIHRSDATTNQSSCS